MGHWRAPPATQGMSRAEKICLTITAIFIVLLFFLLATSELVLAAG